MNKAKQAYGLITTIAMIVGIVIGSGIYFKADDILLATGGNPLLGLLALAIGSACIIFGSLTLSELAQRTSRSGGISSYYEQFVSPAIAAGFGIFQTFVYLPSITAVVSWVGAIYTFLALGVEATLEYQIILAAVYIVFFTLLNIFSRKIGGHFQTVTTMVKLIPLLLVALVGIFWTKAQPDIPSQFQVVPVQSVGWGWITALVPLAFSYDGWTVVVNIAPEVHHPKKNLKRALILGPVIILFTYLLFFYGLTRLLGESFILSTGNSAIQYAINTILGERIGNIFLVIIVISVLGVTNGVLLGGMRMPQALAERQWLNSKRLAVIDPKYQLSLSSGFLFAITSLVWLLIHYITQKYQLLNGRDVSEISIVFNYICFILLYVATFKLYRSGEVTNRLTGWVAPLITTLGSLMLLVGSLLSAPQYVLLFLSISFGFCLIGVWLYRRHRI